MYIIPWDNYPHTSKKGIIADIGDIRVILTEQPSQWILSMGFRVYSADKTKSMVRPSATITRFPKPCTLEDAKLLTEEYINNFITSITNALISQ